MRTLAPKTRYKIEQIRIDDMDGVKKWNLDRFAVEFGHRIEPVFPIFVVLIDGELSAYYYAVPQVCFYPAIHPDKMSSRMFYEVGKTIVAANKQVFGNPLWLVDEDSPVPPEMLKRLHLNQTTLRVYETDQ